MSPFRSSLLASIEKKSLLAHPFYQAWSAGTLSREALCRYAEQYYHLEVSFPRFLSAIHSRTEDPFVRQVILGNLCDEEQGAENHRELWLRFGETIGTTREAMEHSTPLEETTNTITTFRRLCEQSSLEGIAALAAYEAQIPEVATSKLAGLQKYYGIRDARGTRFFHVHALLDREHAERWWEILEEETADPVLEKITHAVEASAAALWHFLDGVMRAYVCDENYGSVECHS